MLKGEKKKNYHKYPYYLRWCDRCGVLFQARTKKARLCDKCKEEINQEKIRKSLIARGIGV